jgi:hypothetical protein
MSIGSSGRIVIEIDPSFKRELYSALARDAKTLKEWFLESAQGYVESGRQSGLDTIESINIDFVHTDQITKLARDAKKAVSGEENE